MSNKKNISEIYQVTKAWKWKSMDGEMRKKRTSCTMTWSLGVCHRNAVRREISSSDLDDEKITHPLWRVYNKEPCLVRRKFFVLFLKSPEETAFPGGIFLPG